jgi:hypothetical protein
MAAMERRALLVALQERLLAEFDASEGRDSAILAKELRAVTLELDSLPTGEVSSVDDLAQRRADRRAKASGQ